MDGQPAARLPVVRRRAKILTFYVPPAGMVLALLSLGLGGPWGLIPLLAALASLVAGFVYALLAMLSSRCGKCGGRPLSPVFPFWPSEPPRCASCGIPDDGMDERR